jgi:parallel beta-helix repeat protein
MKRYLGERVMNSRTLLVTAVLLFLALGPIVAVSPVYALRKWKPTGHVVNAADYLSIQDAINSLPATGGTVFIPAGLYLISSPIRIPSNIILTGEGFDTILKLADGANNNVLENMNLGKWIDSDITITNMQIDGNRENQTGPANGIFLYTAPNSYVHHVWIHNFPIIYPTGIQVSAGIHLLWSPKSTIDRTIIENNSYSGLFVSFSDYATISNNYLYGNHRGIYLRSSNNAKVTKNTIINCDEGIRMYSGASYNRINGNYIESSLEEGIVITHIECKENFIAGNTLVNNSIQIDDHGTNTKIRHNKLIYT